MWTREREDARVEKRESGTMSSTSHRVNKKKNRKRLRWLRDEEERHRQAYKKKKERIKSKRRNEKRQNKS